jgi:uroporphyrinogen decarboxylase
MDKRERLEQTVAGEATDRPPVALWRHWPGDDQRAADLAAAHLQYQEMFDWDFLVVVPSNNFLVTGYNFYDEWTGDASGRREITRYAIKRSLDWTELRTQEPDRGDPGKQIECLSLLSKPLTASQTPHIQVVYSPLAQAARLSGREMLLHHLRRHPDRLRTGLNVLTDTTLRFLDALRRNTSIAGILYVVELASFTMLSEEEYAAFGKPYDLKLLTELPKSWWLNMVQVAGKMPMLSLLANYPVQVINWSDQETHPPLERAQIEFPGAVCGGLGENRHLNLGTPTTVRDAARKAGQAMGQRRLILGSGTTVPTTAPLSNLRAARTIVEGAL